MLSMKLWNGLRIVIVIVLIAMNWGTIDMEAFAAAEPQAPPGLNDPAEVETFLDSFIMAQLKDQHIAGATVAVVKDGELFFAKGYGFADVEKQSPVNPETTVFLIGSAAKLFTWTAVMQLYEQGRVDLDTDINQYLDFRIPATFPEPITLKHLMTHTPGFEETPFGIGAATPEALIPNGAWLARNIPVRRWPPGQVPMYSNYGAGLAGYIVERVSGMPYEAYIEQYILSPLGMTHSTLRQPTPPELAAEQARGYNYINGSFQPQGVEYINVVPAGGLQSSATDMARFMIAHLENGRYCPADCADGEVRILNEDTARQMQSRLWAIDERMNGMAYGFFEFNQNNTRVIGHSGDTTNFHSLLALLPEQNTGLFVSYNSLSSSGAPQALLTAFMDHYYPVQADGPSRPLPDYAERAGRFTGEYQRNRLGFSGGGKIFGFLSSYPVQANSDGELIFGSRRYIEVDPLYFEEVGGDGRILFRENENGNITTMYLNDLPTFAFNRAAWYETTLFNLGLLAVTALLFLSVLVVGLVRLIVSLFRRREQEPQPRLKRLAPATLVALGLAGLAVEIGLFLAIYQLDPGLRVTGQRGLLTVIGGMSILVVLLAAGTAVLAILAWRERWWRAPGRIHYTLVALGSVALAWFLIYWNQVGWQWW